MSQRQRETLLFDKAEVLRRATEARRAAEWDRAQTLEQIDGPHSTMGAGTLSSRWAKNALLGPPGFTPRVPDRSSPPSFGLPPPVTLSYHDAAHMDRARSLPMGPLDVQSAHDEPHRHRPIGAAAREARPLSGLPPAPPAPHGDRRAAGWGRTHSPTEGAWQEPRYDAYDASYHPSHDRARNGYEEASPAQHVSGWDDADVQMAKSRMPDRELPPPPLPPPPPTSTAHGSPKVTSDPHLCRWATRAALSKTSDSCVLWCTISTPSVKPGSLADDLRQCMTLCI